jgi:hypothetical protein
MVSTREITKMAAISNKAVVMVSGGFQSAVIVAQGHACLGRTDVP